MLIILEGVDGAGKSTLAAQLAADIPGAEVRHFSQPEAHPLTEYGLPIEAYRPGTRQHLICDRFHIGEMIYSELYRDGSLLGEAGFWWMRQLLKSRGALVLNVTAPLELIEQRLAERGEDFLESHHVAWVREEFLRWANLGDAWSPESPVPDGYRRALIAEAATREALANRVVGNLPHYVGPLMPDLLLVGDTPNPDSARGYPLHSTVFAPYPGSSGKYLIERVVLQAPNPDAIGLVNAYHHNDEPIDLQGLWYALNCPRVVALGNRAAHLLSVDGVPHSATYHPQYVRRFKHWDDGEYRAAILEEAAT